MFKKFLTGLLLVATTSLATPVASLAENINFAIQPVRAKFGNIVVGASGDLRLSGSFSAEQIDKITADIFKDSVQLKFNGYVEAFASKTLDRGGLLRAAVRYEERDFELTPTLDNLSVRAEYLSSAVNIKLGHIEPILDKSFSIDKVNMGPLSIERSTNKDFYDRLGLAVERRFGRYDMRALVRYDHSAQLQIATDRVIGKTQGWFGLQASYDDLRRLRRPSLDYTSGLETEFARGLAAKLVGELAYGSTYGRLSLEVNGVLEDAYGDIKAGHFSQDMSTIVAAAVSHRWDRLGLSFGVQNQRFYADDLRELTANIGASYAVGTNIDLTGGLRYIQTRDLAYNGFLGEKIGDELVGEVGLRIRF